MFKRFIYLTLYRANQCQGVQSELTFTNIFLFNYLNAILLIIVTENAPGYDQYLMFANVRYIVGVYCCVTDITGSSLLTLLLFSACASVNIYFTIILVIVIHDQAEAK